MKMQKKLGEQVKEFRDSMGWNSTRMAEAVKATRMPGTAKASRQNIEGLEAAGNRIPKYLGALGAVMGKSVDEMLALAGLSATAGGARELAAPSSNRPDEDAVLNAYRNAHPAVRAAILLAADALLGNDAADQEILRREASARLPVKRKKSQRN